MKKLYTFLVFIFCGNWVWGQVMFQKTYGGINEEKGFSVKQTNDSGYIIVGHTFSFGEGGADIYLIKADSIGEILWIKTYGGTAADYGFSVQQTNDEGYIILGYSTSFGTGNEDIYLIKTDNNGNLIWSKTYGGVNNDRGYFVQQTNNGGYIICGYTESFGTGNRDIYLINTDDYGNIIWAKTFGGINDDKANCVQETNDGGFIVTGQAYGDAFIIKIDSIGNTFWAKTFGGISSDFGNYVYQTNDSGYIIAGSTSSFGASIADIYLIKTDSIGNILWSKTFGGPAYDYGSSIQQTTDGGFIVFGYTNSFAGGTSPDLYLVKINALGDTIWTKAFGTGADEYGYAVQQTLDGGFIMAGSSFGFGSGHHDIYLIKTDSLGNGGCNQRYSATTVNIIATIVSIPAFAISSGGTVTIPTTIVGSGGTITNLCTTAGINPISNSHFPISISPNPTINNFTITFPGMINKATIEIYNVLGEKIMEEKMVNASEKEIRMWNAPAGVYFVKTGDVVAKLVKE